MSLIFALLFGAFIIMPLIFVSSVLQRYAEYFYIAAGVSIFAATLIWMFWNTKKSTKLYTLSCMVGGILIVVFKISSWDMKRVDNTIDQECTSRLEQVAETMHRIKPENRFQRSIAIGKASTYPQCNTQVEQWLIDDFYNLDANEEFTEADMEAAFQLHQRLAKPGKICGESDKYEYAYAGIQVRRLGLAGAAQMIRAYIPVDEYNSCTNHYIYLVKNRCAGVWKDRCAAELPRDALEEINKKYKIEELTTLINSVWSNTAATQPL